MKGCDLVCVLLPDELIAEVVLHLEGSKAICDTCTLVCRRWLGIERGCCRHVRIGMYGDADRLIEALVRRFSGLQSICVDQCLPGSNFKSCSAKETDKWSSDARSLMENNAFVENEVECSISDAGLAAVANGCKGLEKLSLIWCSSITSAGLSSIAERCKSLRSLDLQGCYVGDQGLIAVGASCQQFEDLNLRFCEGLTDKGLVGLTKGRTNSLRVLGIAACAWITDTSLKAVASHCSSLESLSLDSEFIKNEGIIAIAEGCRSLRALKLLCRNVRDEGLQAVGSFCSSLNVLALYGFQRFTDRLWTTSNLSLILPILPLNSLRFVTAESCTWGVILFEN